MTTPGRGTTQHLPYQMVLSNILVHQQFRMKTLLPNILPKSWLRDFHILDQQEWGNILEGKNKKGFPFQIFFFFDRHLALSLHTQQNLILRAFDFRYPPWH